MARQLDPGMTEESEDRAYLAAYPQVYRGLVALGARPDEAEDALHDAYVQHLERAEAVSITAWLFVVALRRWRRRRMRERIFQPLRAVARSADFAPEARIDLFEALGKLGRRQ